MTHESQAYTDAAITSAINAHNEAEDPHGSQVWVSNNFVSQDSLGESVPSLIDGQIPSSQLPALPITEANVVGSEEEMLALSAQRGDVAIRTDINTIFTLGTEPPTSEGDDGDFYINTQEWGIYGPKTGGEWGTPTPLVGATGSIWSILAFHP